MPTRDPDLLPEYLRLISLSDREIVLPWPEVTEALDVLRDLLIAVPAWEGWCLYPDGSTGHPWREGVLVVRGQVWVEKMTEESWPAYVQKCYERVIETIQEDRDEWVQDPDVQGGSLYFCLSLDEAPGTVIRPLGPA
jgi:hypothetical protein